ncbi:hypothetical protein ID866_8070 [Astraeus odoratus]|nr:hypothetical protein ID866_8070 [Astraeus odoratus]
MDDSKAAPPPGDDRSVAENSPTPPKEQPDETHSDTSPAEPPPHTTTDMATLVAPNNPTILAPGPGPTAGVNKRYRPAPAKTFQCRGYGDCRMVFSRSEHLARHIRKHTGERPFTCHCSKQFSRLDNLRQHAQTVHADKQEQNDRMMRDLTSLHASMAAANKAGQPRGKRGQATSTATVAAIAASSSAAGLDVVKEEDIVHPIHYRPGTSTGYEGTDSLMYPDDWSSDGGGGGTHPHPRPTNSHSFRDSSQSFRVPLASASSPFYGQHNTQSFLPLATSSTTFSFGLPPSRDGRPGSSSSRPPTAGASAPALAPPSAAPSAEPSPPSSSSHARTLPPLAAVVSASIAAAPSQPPTSSSGLSGNSILPLPAAAAFARRPHTAGRPGTAPASFFVPPPKPAYAGGPGLAHHAELPLPSYGRSAELAAAAGTAAAYHHHHHHQQQQQQQQQQQHGAGSAFEVEPASPIGDSPFSFHPPPAVAEPAAPPPPASAPAGNPRKRPFSGLVDPDESPARREPGAVPPGSAAGGGGEYEYGTESRPQSRRLSVMELCNDADVDGTVRSFLSAAAGNGGSSRPSTSSGLCTSASALALVDRSPSTTSATALLPGAQTATTPSATPTTAAATTTGAQTAFGGGRLSPGVRREPTASPSPSYSAGPGNVLRTIPGADPAAPSLPWPPLSSRRGDAQPQHQLQQQHLQYGAQQQQHAGQQQQQQQQRETRSPVANAYSTAAVGMKA